MSWVDHLACHDDEFEVSGRERHLEGLVETSGPQGGHDLLLGLLGGLGWGQATSGTTTIRSTPSTSRYRSGTQAAKKSGTIFILVSSNLELKRSPVRLTSVGETKSRSSIVQQTLGYTFFQKVVKYPAKNSEV